MSSLLPELITEILLRLPAKDLLRFKSVSKLFLSLIDGPDFINLHLKISIRTNTRLNLILYNLSNVYDEPPENNFPPRPRDPPTRIYSADVAGGIESVVELRNPLSSPRHSTRIRGSCDGLLLLYNTDQEIALWNPFTKRHRRLPFCPIQISFFMQPSSFGFGYDSTADDYKVVRISEIPRSRKQVWVFSLRSGSWRRVHDFPFDGYTFWAEPPARFAEGVLYWLCRRGYEERVIALDLQTESFHEVPIPASFRIRTEHDAEPEELIIPRLEVLGGTLCMNLVTPWNSFELYLRKRHDNGVRFTWSQLYKAKQSDFGDLNIDEAKPLVYLKERHKVLLDINGMEIAWYDLELKRGEMVKFTGIPIEFNSLVCWESLVSLGGDSQFDDA